MMGNSLEGIVRKAEEGEEKKNKKNPSRCNIRM
jgi:hypothetical protein